MKKFIFSTVLTLTLLFGVPVVFAGDTSYPTATPDAGTQYTNYTRHATTGTDYPSSAGEPSTVYINVRNLTFTPATITVIRGSSVLWPNNDRAAHAITGDTTDGPRGGVMQPGQQFGFSFNHVGTFTYHCAIHPEMRGTVVVKPSAEDMVAAAQAAQNQSTNTSSSATNSAVSDNTTNVTPANTTATTAPAASTPSQQPAAAPVATDQLALNLPNTGASVGGLAAIFGASTITGTLLYYFRSRRNLFSS
jgi:LPXTG-motif cell wall-anchored protein